MVRSVQDHAGRTQLGQCVLIHDVLSLSDHWREQALQLIDGKGKLTDLGKQYIGASHSGGGNGNGNGTTSSGGGGGSGGSGGGGGGGGAVSSMSVLGLLLGWGIAWMMVL